MKTYYTHDNGGRPFKVTINRNIVKVYKQNPPPNWNSIPTYEDNPSYTYSPSKIFVGKSPRIRMTEFSGGYGREFGGNSFLLHMENDRYIFIGNSIFQFRSDSPIKKYVSPVGNNDVPYPYAVTNDDQYILLIEDVVIRKIPEDYDGDPYDYYYNTNHITSDEGFVPPKQAFLDPPFHNIEQFWIDDDRYTLRYKPFAGNEYDRLTSLHRPGQKLYLKYSDRDEKEEISKDEWINMMGAFARRMGFRSLQSKIEIQPRL